MSGELIAALVRGGAARPPYIPLIGALAAELGQISLEQYVTDAQAQAVALSQSVHALGADVATVGVGTDPAIGQDVLRRLRPLLGGKGVAGVVAGTDVAAARGYCEEGAQLLLLSSPEIGPRLKTFANACRFYDVPTILVAPELEDAADVAAAHGLSGALVASPTGDEPGIVGGGLSPALLGGAAIPAAPRRERFFWSFAGEVPTGILPEDLAGLGAALTS